LVTPAPAANTTSNVATITGQRQRITQVAKAPARLRGWSSGVDMMGSISSVLAPGVIPTGWYLTGQKDIRTGRFV